MPINGQYPRPWFTDLKRPDLADVFVVGRNQATTYSVDRLTHEKHIDSLFNRNNESCLFEYQIFRPGKSSRTRSNMNSFISALNRHNIINIIQTDLICYSTPQSYDLKTQYHRPGMIRGREIFSYIYKYIKPRIVILFGLGTIKDFRKHFGIAIPDAPTRLAEPPFIEADKTQYYSVRSLAPPAWNSWHSWAEDYFEKIAGAVSKVLEK